MTTQLSAAGLRSWRIITNSSRRHFPDGKSQLTPSSKPLSGAGLNLPERFECPGHRVDDTRDAGPARSDRAFVVGNGIWLVDVRPGSLSVGPIFRRTDVEAIDRTHDCDLDFGHRDDHLEPTLRPASISEA